VCFAVNQANKKALESQLELWTRQDLARLGWAPRRWMNAFARPSLPVVLSEPREVALAQWGLVPTWVKTVDQAGEMSLKTLNARSETMFGLPSFRGSAEGRRCLVPVNGFYEYQHRDDGKVKVPYLITLKDDDVMWLGGLWSEWQGVLTFTICTMDANSLMSEIHNSRRRMPVVVRPEQFGAWLGPGGPEALAAILTPDDALPLAAVETEGPDPAGQGGTGGVGGPGRTGGADGPSGPPPIQGELF
jgi:putative SOS response-associated peptidase YedK